MKISSLQIPFTILQNLPYTNLSKRNKKFIRDFWKFTTLVGGGRGSDKLKLPFWKGLVLKKQQGITLKKICIISVKGGKE